MLDVSKIYESNNSGKFKVISYINARKVEVEFIDTGYRRFSEAKDIKNGEVKDRLAPSVLGIGYLGDGEYKSGVSSKINKAYYVWRGMLQRCYCPKSLVKNPTYKGCEVDKEWHNFQVFAEWFSNTYPCDNKSYELDKDILSGSRVGKLYSEITCKWVPSQENSEYSQAMTFSFIGPGGKRVEVFNLTKFCRDNGLSQGCMSNVNKGVAKSHKGWTKA